MLSRKDHFSAYLIEALGWDSLSIPGEEDLGSIARLVEFDIW